MKRAPFLSRIAFASLSIALTTAHAETSQVNLYNWYGFIAPDALGNFERETGSRVLLDSFDSAEIMQSKIMASHTGYDVVIATSNVLPNLIKAGVLAPIDHAKLKAWGQLDSEVLNKLSANDPGNQYAVPYLWGTTGIGYDVDKVKAALGKSAPTDSWDLIFKEENVSKLKDCGVAMLDSPSEIVSIALHYLGLPYNSKDPEDYQKAQKLLMQIRPYIRYFDSSKIDADLADGNICVVVGWANGALAAKRANDKAKTGRVIAYSIPREGALVWSENMVLLKDAPHPEQGLAFINYMMKPEVIAKTSNFTFYPNANTEATKLVDQDLRDNPAIYLSKEQIDRLFPLEPLPLKLERLRTRVWTKVKSGL
ncbi:polyamine ABC transporter substrate-binding protein [Pseudomonas fragariae (ex Marin et al. 2024)]|uniref:polyamine ABC transporter substrate-binding protein n=1 Tax=Pseudomonas fragariae (ex Marin et al. 2024) TaxID=3080056 RepID=UPI003F7A3039